MTTTTETTTIAAVSTVAVEPTYYLTAAGAGGKTPDGTLPDGAVECTQAQSENPQAWTISNGTIVAASDDTQLANAKPAQNSLIDASYLAAIQVDVSFTTAAGVTKTYQADCVSGNGTDSQSVLLKTVTGYELVGAVPSGFAWKSTDNTMVAFTLDDLKGLYSAMLTQGQAAFTKRATKKASIAAATTVPSVQAITWDSTETATTS